MKVRNGFVSNSSSSSFVITTTLENHKRALSKLSPYVAAVLEAMGGEEKKAFGVDLITFSTYMDNGGGGTFEGLDVEYEPETKSNKKGKMKVVEEESAVEVDDKDLEEDEELDDDGDLEDDEEGDPYEAFEQYCNEIKKDKKNVIETSIDF